MQRFEALCLGCLSQRRAPGLTRSRSYRDRSLVASGPAMRPAGLGDVGKIQVGETFAVVEGTGHSKSQRWRLHFFPAGGEVPYFLGCQ